jgi:hypothetical protein
MRKRPESRYASVAELIKDLRKYQDALRAEELGAFSLQAFLRRIRRPIVVIPAVCMILVIALIAVWFFNRQAKIRWAREEALPEIERLILANWSDTTGIYRLAENAEKYIPNDPKLTELLSLCSLNINIKTEPPGANIYIKEYDTPDNEWEYLGLSPIENIRLPVGIMRYKIEKQGYETVMAASSTWDISLVLLFPKIKQFPMTS